MKEDRTAQPWILALGVGASIAITTYLFLTPPTTDNTAHVALFMLSTGLPIFSVALYLESRGDKETEINE